MKKTRNKPKELLPYGMLLTRLFKHVVSVFPELAIDHYLSHDRVMHPLAPYYERKTRSDHGKKRPRESNASSSSTTQNHPSSSLPLDAIVDKNDEESFHSNSFSHSQNISSSSNVVSRVRQNLPHESQHLNTYLFETINIQTQQRDDHRKGLRELNIAKDLRLPKEDNDCMKIKTREKICEYEMWRLRIEQYFQVQDYALWDVIENGNSFKPTARTIANADGTSTSMIPGPVTTEEKA
ncbi:hypothetical protein Tco_0702232 [Tanacetum coccineum]|uniref:Uncharacterized protein n=1 Tax=Tanacetum coccineum TaxID=301880 RepID=A0ABQ4XWZ7_9ASTR